MARAIVNRYTYRKWIDDPHYDRPIGVRETWHDHKTKSYFNDHMSMVVFKANIMYERESYVYIDNYIDNSASFKKAIAFVCKPPLKEKYFSFIQSISYFLNAW